MISQTEYLEEIESLAASIVEECRAEEPADLREAVSDRIWETIDGHQWIIYTAYNRHVLARCSDPDYWPDNFGMDGATGADDILSKLAFGGMYSDLTSAIDWDALDEEQEEEDDTDSCDKIEDCDDCPESLRATCPAWEGVNR